MNSWLAEKQDEQLIKKALDDWYLAEKKDYDSFAAKYPMNGELLEQGAKLTATNSWCRKMEVFATPTFFLDETEVPGAYNIEDLEYFLLEQFPKGNAWQELFRTAAGARQPKPADALSCGLKPFVDLNFKAMKK